MKEKELEELKQLLTTFSQKFEQRLCWVEEKLKEKEEAKPLEKTEVAKPIMIPPQTKNVVFIIRTAAQEWKFNLIL